MNASSSFSSIFRLPACARLVGELGRGDHLVALLGRLTDRLQVGDLLGRRVLGDQLADGVADLDREPLALGRHVDVARRPELDDQLVPRTIRPLVLFATTSAPRVSRSSSSTRAMPVSASSQLTAANFDAGSPFAPDTRFIGCVTRCRL